MLNIGMLLIVMNPADRITANAMLSLGCDTGGNSSSRSDLRNCHVSAPPKQDSTQTLVNMRHRRSRDSSDRIL